MTTPDHQRVRELFRQAVELSADQRVAFLDSECAGDSVHRQAVEELLQHHSTKPLLLNEDDRRPSSAGREKVSQHLSSTHVAENFGDRFVNRIGSQFRRERRLILILAPLAALLLTVLGIWVHRSIRDTVRDNLEETLQVILDQQVLTLRYSLRSVTELVNSWARTPELRESVATLCEEAVNAVDPRSQLSTSPEGLRLRGIIHQLSGWSDTVRYAVWSRDGMLIAQSDDQLNCLGNLVTPYGGELLSRPFSGEDVIWLPTTDGYITKGYAAPEGDLSPELAIIVPIYGSTEQSRPIGCLLISEIGLQRKFEDLFESTRYGVSGEFYAMDRRGYLMTNSRIADQLRDVGMIDGKPGSLSAGVIRVADPGGDITEGFRPSLETIEELPLTYAARAAIAGRSGSNFEGYSDYRGVKVVGAWRWLDEFGFGVIAELDYQEAFESLVPLRRAYWLLIGLLCLALLWCTAVSFAWVRARNAAGIAAQIGPYKIERKIGEGGLGRVFLATHVLLKRPTALKLLKPETLNAINQRRFYREIHLASSLMHPNTIEIYDYGKTAEGGFYSAMEFVDGLNLAQVIDLDGPQRPERVIWILSEACRSLREAHAGGLIHRDIKPENIMLCCQGGEADTVKVLDFGLAREINDPQGRVTETRILVGTPMYIAPERIADPTCIDPRSDIYSLGVVGYFLLTGREPFAAGDAMEALAGAMNNEPPPASKYAAWAIPAKLEALVTQCQAKNVAGRISSVAELLQGLSEVECDGDWTREHAARWWQIHAPDIAERSNLPQTRLS